MKTVLVACLLQGVLLFTLTEAQVPTPPALPETFMASGEVELHAAEATFFGKFNMGRNQMAEMGVELEEYEAEVSEALYRYDNNKTYYLRGDREKAHCLQEDRNFNGMPKFWDWLQYSTYEGTETVREVVYDLWGTNVGGVRLEFGSPRTNSSILYYYRRKSTELSVFYSFMMFTNDPPNPDMFKVPEECDRK